MAQSARRLNLFLLKLPDIFCLRRAMPEKISKTYGYKARLLRLVYLRGEL